MQTVFDVELVNFLVPMGKVCESEHYRMNCDFASHLFFLITFW